MGKTNLGLDRRKQGYVTTSSWDTRVINKKIRKGAWKRYVKWLIVEWNYQHCPMVSDCNCNL